MTTQIAPDQQISEWGCERLDVDAYLSRIGDHGPLTPTGDTLRRLHRAHVSAIPFENLDIMLGREIPLDIDSIQSKLVYRLRGGYCSEHNLLFGALLERIGFKVNRLVGRTRMGSTKVRHRSHTMLRVQDSEGGDWIADVGFGGEGLLDPVPLRTCTVMQGSWLYRLDPVEDDMWVLRSRHPEGWFDLYTFSVQPERLVDIVVHNYFTSTNPSSPYVRRIVVQRTTPRSRFTLIGPELTETRPDGTVNRRVVPREEIGEVLWTIFGIELTPDELANLQIERAA